MPQLFVALVPGEGAPAIASFRLKVCLKTRFLPTGPGGRRSVVASVTSVGPQGADGAAPSGGVFKHDLTLSPHRFTIRCFVLTYHTKLPLLFRLGMLL